eukprot:355982-Chlamydomonas_euryale.AAC.6
MPCDQLSVGAAAPARRRCPLAPSLPIRVRPSVRRRCLPTARLMRHFQRRPSGRARQRPPAPRGHVRCRSRVPRGRMRQLSCACLAASPYSGPRRRRDALQREHATAGGAHLRPFRNVAHSHIALAASPQLHAATSRPVPPPSRPLTPPVFPATARRQDRSPQSAGVGVCASK